MIEDMVKRYLVEQVRQAVERLTRPLLECGMLPDGATVHVDLVLPGKLEKVEATIGVVGPEPDILPPGVIEPRAVGQSRRSASLDAVARLEGQIDPTQPIPWPSEPTARLKMLEEAERAYLLSAGWKPVSGSHIAWHRMGRTSVLQWEAIEIQRAEDGEP